MTRITDTEFEAVELELADAFEISRGTTHRTTNHLVTLTDETGVTGVGGAAPSSYYGESAESVERVLPALLDAVSGMNPFNQQAIEQQLVAIAPEQAAARAAVSVAVYDLAATHKNEPLYQRFGLDPERTPVTSVTVGIDSPEMMADRARNWMDAGYPALKVKLGTDNDRARLNAVRDGAPDARIRVDVNGDWNRETALEQLSWLESCDVELLEQPVPADDIAGLRAISQETSIPVAADESCVTAADVPRVADAVDAVVVKLMKCGGLGEAYRQIVAANAHGLETMLGCMVETSASISGACHLTPLTEFADLDGALLLTDEPCTGVRLSDGRIGIREVVRGTGAQCQP